MLFYLIFLSIIVYLILIFTRNSRYKYKQELDYLYNLTDNLIEETVVINNKLQLKAELKNYDSIFLKVTLSPTVFSYFLKPYIEIENIKHYFEYRAKGIRYINISHTKNKTIALKLKNIKILNKELSLYGYNNNIDLSKKILILAPHADDAEIAAFGLYKKSDNVTILTTPAAENGACNYCDVYHNDVTKQAIKKAELRAFDAICVPLLGNVPINNSLALGYFGGTLKWMSQNRDKKAISQVENINDMNQFRKVSHSNIALSSNVEPKYSDFFNDLKSVIEQGNYDIIITPHPSIDSHTDHKYTTLTLIDVLQSSNNKADLLLYTNHLKLSETYPIGDMNSAITLPPNQEDFYFNSIYSFELEKDLQIDKFFALEAIHDLRDSLMQISIKKAYKHFSRLLRRRVAGKDKSYYKRAIRANELFFVVKNKNINKLMDV